MLHKDDDKNEGDQDDFERCEDKKHKTRLIFFTSGGNLFVKFIISDAKDFKRIVYNFDYIHNSIHNSIIEDVQGSKSITSDIFTSDPIQLGTCSSDICIDHKDAHGFKLTITLKESTFHQDHHDGKEDKDVTFRHEE